MQLNQEACPRAKPEDRKMDEEPSEGLLSPKRWKSCLRVGGSQRQLAGGKSGGKSPSHTQPGCPVWGSPFLLSLSQQQLQPGGLPRRGNGCNRSSECHRCPACPPGWHHFEILSMDETWCFSLHFLLPGAEPDSDGCRA